MNENKNLENTILVLIESFKELSIKVSQLQGEIENKAEQREAPLRIVLACCGEEFPNHHFMCGCKIGQPDNDEKNEQIDLTFPKRKPIPEKLKQKILAIGRCEYCGSLDNLSVDHIRPVSLGGTNDIGNLQCLCFPCNIKKGAKLSGVYK